MDTFIQSGLQIIERLRDEAKTATRSWTLIEAYIGRDEAHRENLRQGLSRAGLGMTSNVVMKALSRDVLSALFRATDERGKNSLTVCALVALLNESSARETIDSYIHAEAPDWQQGSALMESSEGASKILAMVPTSWKNRPQDCTLLDLRTKLKPIRDSLLSHALDYTDVQQATFDETRSFLRTVNEVQHSASRVFYASTQSLQVRWDVALKEAHRFWDMEEIGVSSNQEDLSFRP